MSQNDTSKYSQNAHRRAALYARVSGDDRANDGRNLAGQIEMGRKYAREHGLIVVAELAEDDKGASGAEIDLPQLNRALEMSRAGECDVLVVREIDRLSRSLAKQLIVEEELKRAGVEIAYVLGEYPNTPEGSLMKNVKAAVAEYERLKIVERNVRGKRLKARSGKVVGDGHAPYGYKYENSKLVIIEEQARIIRLIYTWYLVGDGDSGPMPVLAIAKRLSEMGVPTPGEHLGRPRKRAPHIWGMTSIWRMLKSETYCGTWRYGKRIGHRGKGGKRAVEEQIAVECPPIVDRATWQAAQAKMAYNTKMSKRNSKRQYLLTSRITCGCGRAFAGSHRHGHRYYCCSTHAHRYRKLEPRTCFESAVQADLIEHLVWDRFVIEGILADPDELKRKLEAAQSGEYATAQPKRDRLAVVKDLIEKKERRIRFLMSSFGDDLDDNSQSITDVLREEIKSLGRERDSLIKERDELAGELDQETLSNDEIQAALNYREHVMAGMQNPTFEDKRRALEMFRVEVKISGGVATVTGRLKIEKRQFDLQQEAIAFRAKNDAARWSGRATL